MIISFYSHLSVSSRLYKNDLRFVYKFIETNTEHVKSVYEMY